MTQGTQLVTSRPRAAQVTERPVPVEPPAARPRRGTWVRRHPGAVGLLPSLVLAALVTREAAWRSPDGRLHWSLFDDVMISMSYARTLARTGELVWYPGAPRTEGMTNLGWTLVMALLHKLGLSGDEVVLTVILIGLVVVWATAFRGRAIVALLSGATDPLTRFLAVLAVATCFPLLWWTMRGMEVGLLTLLTLVVVNATLAVVQQGPGARRHALLLALVLASGIAIRTDFALVAGAIVLWLVARPPSRPHLRTAGLVAAVTAISGLACAAFRLAYYGDPVPNTYYLKLTGVLLSDRLERGALTTVVSLLGYFVGPALIVAFGWHRLGRPAREVARLVGLVALMGALYGLSVGGDAWEYFLLPNRYLTPSLVLLLLLAVGVLRAPPADTGPAGERRSSQGLAAAVLLAGAGPTIVYLLVLRFPRADLSLVALAEQSTWFPVALPVLLASVVFAAVLLRPTTAPPRRRRGASDRALVVAIVLLSSAGAVASGGLAFGALDSAANYSILGDQIASVTRPGARVAVVAAGATQYVSGRAAVDLLGKSDEHIAKRPPATTELVLPGHDKYDFAYSIGSLQPDLVAQPWRDLGPDDLVGWGYLPYGLADGEFGAAAYAVCGGERVMWALPGSPHVRWDRLRALDPARCD